jgi:hypothetical protein
VAWADAAVGGLLALLRTPDEKAREEDLQVGRRESRPRPHDLVLHTKSARPPHPGRSKESYEGWRAWTAAPASIWSALIMGREDITWSWDASVECFFRVGYAVRQLTLGCRWWCVLSVAAIAPRRAGGQDPGGARAARAGVHVGGAGEAPHQGRTITPKAVICHIPSWCRAHFRLELDRSSRVG